jgi:hypothetical protein
LVNKPNTVRAVPETNETDNHIYIYVWKINQTLLELFQKPKKLTTTYIYMSENKPNTVRAVPETKETDNHIYIYVWKINQTLWFFFWHIYICGCQFLWFLEQLLQCLVYFSDIYIYVVISFFGFWNSSNSVVYFRHIYVVVSFFGFLNSSNSVWFIFQTYIYMWLSVSLVSRTALTVWRAVPETKETDNHIYIYVWKINQTLLELF